MQPLDLYRQQLWQSWATGARPQIEDIPPSKAQLISRVAGPAFDGGRTATWIAHLREGGVETWRAVRDARTGHTIHVISDRSHAALTADLTFGLRLMAWMSRRPIVWYWWDQPWTREVPAHVDPGRDHVNGGWAIPGVLEVHVYRREEAHKVLLHESIHALGLDVPMGSVEPVRAQFEAALGRTLWPHLGECFTELFAEWLWSIADAQSLAAAAGRWRYQLTCSEHQAAAIWVRIRDATAAEDTNVFAYYILKWVLMQHSMQAILGPDHSVHSWFAWWQAARPRLEALAAAVADTEAKSMLLGMTCNA
jgi:hypothetical protein